MVELMLKNVFFVIFFLFNRTFVLGYSTSRCLLPDGCRREGIYDRTFAKDWILNAIFCDINNDEFEFKFNEPALKPNDTLTECDSTILDTFAFRWTNELAILGAKFNMTNFDI